MLDLNSEHLEASLGAWRCAQSRAFVFDVLHHNFARMQPQILITPLLKPFHRDSCIVPPFRVNLCCPTLNLYLAWCKEEIT